MAWLSIRLSLPAARIETLSDLLMELGAESRCRARCGRCTGARARARRDTVVAARRTRRTVSARGRSRIAARASRTPNWPMRTPPRSMFASSKMPIGRTRGANYAVEHCFGDRLWVLPRDAPLPDGRAAVLRIDPGLAFGTGGHATTAMCLEWLARQKHRWMVCGRLRRGFGDSRHRRVAAWRASRGCRRS